MALAGPGQKRQQPEGVQARGPGGGQDFLGEGLHRGPWLPCRSFRLTIQIFLRLDFDLYQAFTRPGLTLRGYPVHVQPAS